MSDQETKGLSENERLAEDISKADIGCGEAQRAAADFNRALADLELRFHTEKRGEGILIRHRVHPLLVDALKLMATELCKRPNAVLESCIWEYHRSHFDSSRNMVEDLRHSLDSLWYSLDQLGAELASLSDVALAACLAEATDGLSDYENEG